MNYTPVSTTPQPLCSQPVQTCPPQTSCCIPATPAGPRYEVITHQQAPAYQPLQTPACQPIQAPAYQCHDVKPEGTDQSAMNATELLIMLIDGYIQSCAGTQSFYKFKTFTTSLVKLHRSQRK